MGGGGQFWHDVLSTTLYFIILENRSANVPNINWPKSLIYSVEGKTHSPPPPHPPPPFFIRGHAPCPPLIPPLLYKKDVYRIRPTDAMVCVPLQRALNAQDYMLECTHPICHCSLLPTTCNSSNSPASRYTPTTGSTTYTKVGTWPKSAVRDYPISGYVVVWANCCNCSRGVHEWFGS